MILSGDDLTNIPEPRLAMLQQLEPPTGVAARFADDSLEVGVVDLKDRKVVCLLNWTDAPKTLSFAVPSPRRLREVWSGEDLGSKQGNVSIPLGPRDGKLIF